MLYILWALINIGLFISFIIICFKATKLIREHIGWFGVVVFVFGLLSFIAGSGIDDDNPEPGSNKGMSWQFNQEDSLLKQTKTVLTHELKKTLISTYILGVEYGEGQQPGLNLPIRATTWTTGFTSGTRWRPSTILVTATADNQKFEYEVHGTIKWLLLGFTVYDESKTWKGELSLQ